MRQLLHLFHQLSAWLHHRLAPPYRTRFIEEDLPQWLDRKTIYIVREDGFLWHASMLCPCGCGELLHMNLIPSDRPCWQLTKHQNRTVTLYPSIWRKKGCYSHFWFRHGRVLWCRGY